jgi:hypothetical protein
VSKQVRNDLFGKGNVNIISPTLQRALSRRVTLFIYQKVIAQRQLVPKLRLTHMILLTIRLPHALTTPCCRCPHISLSLVVIVEVSEEEAVGYGR